MPKKPKYCVGAVSQRGNLKCPVCDEVFHIAGLKPVNKKKIDKEIAKFATQNRIHECFLCDHKVILCKNCIRSEDVAICDCCLEEAENL